MRPLIVTLIVIVAPSLAYLLTAWVVQRSVGDARRAAAARAEGPRCEHRSPHPEDDLAPDLTCQDKPGHASLVHYSGPWYWTAQDAETLAASRGRATPGQEAA